MNNPRLQILVMITAFGPMLSAAADQPLPTVKEAPCRKALEVKIAQAKRTVEGYQTGHVVVGRVVLDGAGDPRDIRAQMEILPGGYFAGETKDLDRPIGFRMHQYAPLDVELKGLSGEIVDIGTVHMRQFPGEDLIDVKGRIELDGRKDTTGASIRFSVMGGPVNTPHNGTSPRKRWPLPIKADIAVDGAISATGFSPIKYYCTVTAPGFVKQSFPVTFEPGKMLDLGTIRLERPIRIALSYIVSDKPPFDLSRMQQTVLSAGERWKCTPDIYGWDLEFKQKGGDLFFDYSYSPCSLQDLGEGTLEDLVKEANAASPKRNPHNQTVQNGHVYIVNQGHWKRWILLSVNIQGD